TCSALGPIARSASSRARSTIACWSAFNRYIGFSFFSVDLDGQVELDGPGQHADERRAPERLLPGVLERRVVLVGADVDARDDPLEAGVARLADHAEVRQRVVERAADDRLD